MLGLAIGSAITSVVMHFVNINKKNFNMGYKIGFNLFFNFISCFGFLVSLYFISTPYLAIPLGITAAICLAFFIFHNVS
jgi:hypothetical protein